MAAAADGYWTGLVCGFASAAVALVFLPLVRGKLNTCLKFCLLPLVRCLKFCLLPLVRCLKFCLLWCLRTCIQYVELLPGPTPPEPRVVVYKCFHPLLLAPDPDEPESVTVYRCQRCSKTILWIPEEEVEGLIFETWYKCDECDRVRPFFVETMEVVRGMES
jgi:DNA-directed RNA polymerase subunit RPC12/RpoP